MKNDDARLMFYPENKEFTKEEDRDFARERLVFNVTEDILLMMEALNVSKADLAKQLSKSKAHVSQILSGERNMTLGTLSDICFALSVEPMIKFAVNNQIIDFANSDLEEVSIKDAPDDVCGLVDEHHLQESVFQACKIPSVIYGSRHYEPVLHAVDSEVGLFEKIWEHQFKHESTDLLWQDYSNVQLARAS